MTITKTEAKEKIYSAGNKIFTVTFVKKDGTVRQMNCRLNVKKHLKGGKLAYNPKEYDLISCFDVQKKDYRMINCQNLLMLKIEKNEFKIGEIK